MWLSNFHLYLNSDGNLEYTAIFFYQKKDMQHYTEPKPKNILSLETSCSLFDLHFHYWHNLFQAFRLQVSSFVTVFFFSHSPIFQNLYSSPPLVLTHPFQSFQCQSLSLPPRKFERPLMIFVSSVFPFLIILHITIWIIFLKCRFVPMFSLIKKEKEKFISFQ